MELILKNIAHLTTIVTWLNIRKVMLLAVVSLLALTFLTAYEHRAQFVTAFMNSTVEINGTPVKLKALIVPVEMQDKIKLLVDHSPLILSIAVLNTDLQLNQHTLVYRYADTIAYTQLRDKFDIEHGKTQPIFNNDDKNNAQIVRIINGEFICDDFKDTASAVAIPELAKITPVICRISLPPYYGEFSGYLAAGLTHSPSINELAELMIQLKGLSNELFLKNIVAR